MPSNDATGLASGRSDAEVSNGSSPVPIELRNFAALILAIAGSAWALWYYADLQIDQIKAFAALATGGIAGTLYGFLPETVKTWISSRTKPLLGSNRLTLVTSSYLMVLLGCGTFLTRTAIEWTEGHPTIAVDGRPMAIQVDERLHSLWGLPFKKRSITVGDDTISVRPLPFIIERIKLSESEVYSGTPGYEEITDLLRLAFFQYVENRFLSKAQEEFASDAAKKYTGLNRVYAILKLCFVEDDIARSGDLLAERFKAEYPSSTWNPLLGACLHYGRQEYVQASGILALSSQPSDPSWLATYTFFRGVNRLKQAIHEMAETSGSSRPDLAPAIIDFQTAARTLLETPDNYFRSVSLPSAQILEGIANVYERKLDASEVAFGLATKASYPGLRARAYSDLGYVHLMRGDIAAAKSNFTAALVEDATFPYARTNLGYAYMAEGKYEAARQIFLGISKDTQLQAESMRDVVLARVALAHIDAVTGKSENAPSAYEDVLKLIKQFDYAGVEPYQLRESLIHFELGDKLYRDPKYYGLEIFALAMYARSYQEAQSVPDHRKGDQAEELAERALTSFQALRRVVDPGWFVFQPSNGYFRPIYDVDTVVRNRTTN